MYLTFQYYATVESRASTSNDDVLWLSKENIEYVEDVSDIAGVAGMPEMIGSGQSVGGVVSDTLAPVSYLFNKVQSVCFNTQGC